MKKFISLFLILAISLSFSVTAFAASKKDNSSTNTYPILRSIIPDYFSNHDKYTVVDKSNNSINEKFFNENSAAYSKGDIDTIVNYVVNNIAYFSKSTEITENKQLLTSASILMPLTSVSKKATTWKLEVAHSDDYPHDFEVQTFITGVYIVNSNSGDIISARNPVISYKANPGAMWSTSMTNASTGYTISSDKTTVHFTGMYQLTAILGVSIGNFPIGLQCDYGYHSVEVDGYD